MIPRTMRFTATAAMFLFAGCGPVAIGAGLGSAGGGGGGGASGPVPPSLVVEPAPFQPEDDATLFGVRLSQPAGRSVALRFEYDAGSGRVQIPATSLQGYDVAARAPQALPDVGASGDLSVATSDGGVAYFFLWNHAADLGQVEVRNVTLFAVYADAADGISAGTQATDTVFLPRTLGREVGELTDTAVSRVSGSDPESSFVVDTVYLDRGADLAVASFDVDFAITATAPAEMDYLPLGDIEPTVVSESELADGRRRSQIRFTIDPVQAGLPLGQFQKVWFRLSPRETYPLERSDVPVSTLPGTPALADLDAAQIGYRPRIETAFVVDPGDGANNAGEGSKPWLRLPIAMRLYNPSPVLPMQVRIDGTYTVLGTFPITPVESDDPSSSTTVTLQPQERRSHYLIWNVIADEGLGNTLDITETAPNNTVRSASVSVSATLLASGSLPVIGGAAALSDSQSAGATTLNTLPFVGFRENLAQQVRRIWSSGDQITQETRNLFFTRPNPSPSVVQETRVLLDQQFEAVQYVPAPPPFDYFDQYGFTNGVFDIVPTDFVPDAPDCIVWVNSQFRFLTWPGSGSAQDEFIANSGGQFFVPGPISFTLEDGADVYNIAVFYAFSRSDVGLNQQVELNLSIVVRKNGIWQPLLSPPAETFQIYGQPSYNPPQPQPNVPINLQPVGGEFDGDASSYELVIGNLGTEYATAQLPGLLHMWSFRVAGGQVTIDPRVELPKLTPPAVGATWDIEPWLMERWRPAGATRDRLVVVREVQPEVVGDPRQFEVFSLAQQPAGGFVGSSWQLVSDQLTGADYDVQIARLNQVFTADLDGNVDGLVGSDLMLLLTERDNATNDVSLDLWLFADSANANGGQPTWRRILRDVGTIDPVTFQGVSGRVLGGACQLVDVNGDRLLDFVTAEEIPINAEDSNYNYFASSLGSVAGGLGDVANSAGASPCVLPAVLDANVDGLSDLISGRRLHVAQFNGLYQSEPQLLNVGGGTTSRHRIERLQFAQAPDQFDLLVFDPVVAVENKVQRISGVGSPTQTYSFATLFDLNGAFGGAAIQDLWPLTAPDSAARGIKDLAALVGAPNSLQLQRARLDITSGSVTPEALWTGPADQLSGLAVVRRVEIQLGDKPEGNASVQDLVVVDAGANNGRLAVLRSDNGYGVEFVDVPTGLGRIVRMAAASVTADAFEDICVLTEQTVNFGTPNAFQAYRVLCFEHVPGSGITSASPVRELARFTEPFASTAVRAFGFNRGARSLANGFLLLDDEAPASTRSEIRLLRPIVDAGSVLRLRSVVSPLDQPADQGAEAVVVDANQDGQVEVVTGAREGTPDLRRLRTNLGN